MHIKEYRIPLPMSVEEYRIAQLYMIQKKSREESDGAGSGVEIIVNEPYTDGPGGNGQYTYKIFHIGSHLPGWFRAILPKSALRVEEQAWNAYPYTKTRYRCPFIEKFVLEIETRYFNDGGTQDNVFNLTNAEKRERIVDILDIVKDPISSSDYKKEEDPRLYKSTKTKRGPLNDNWLEDYTKISKSPKSNERIMCAYKLCKVEFKYWGMQNKIERFIHDIGLRKTMMRAHRQAWSWQDEWYGLELEDIRRLERETQELLAQKFGSVSDEENEEVQEDSSSSIEQSPNIPKKSTRNSFIFLSNETITENGDTNVVTERQRASSFSQLRPRASSGRRSTVGSRTSLKSAEADWRLEKLETLQDDSSDGDDEFFDAFENLEKGDLAQSESLGRASSCDLLTPDDEFNDALTCEEDACSLLAPDDEFDDALTCEEDTCSRNNNSYLLKKAVDFKKEHQIHSLDIGDGISVQSLNMNNCKTSVLFLVLHGGSILDMGSEQTSKQADIGTLRVTFDSVIRSHYPHILGHIALRLVSCPPICSETINSLLTISPFNHDSHSSETSVANHEFIPLGAIPLLFTSSPDYQDTLYTVVARANHVYNEFLKSEEGLGFSGQVCLVGDSVGGVLGYDALCQSSAYLNATESQSGSQSSLLDLDNLEFFPASPCKTNLKMSHPLSLSNPDIPKTEVHVERPRMKSEAVLPDIDVMRISGYSQRHSASPRRTSTSSSFAEKEKFDFEVTDFFMFGSPLALVLNYRRMSTGERNGFMKRPICHQLYNLFHSTDPSAARLEPIVDDKFKHIGPVKIPRYQKFPLGDGRSVHVVINKWWGTKRIDYALYSPEALHSFPLNSLPDLFHARYWESQDVIAFILRQVVRHDLVELNSDTGKGLATFQPSRAREKWLHRRTTIKVRNVAPNHRANDVLVLEDKPQILSARFMYGPLDVVALSGEKVDIHIMTQPQSGDWEFFGTESTDNHGRLAFTVPGDRQLSQGMYPVKMVVRGDHTCADFFLTVLPPATESVVFSIDGSFTASVSIMGRDPKVRAAAVDVVRHWQELGYLILYVSARPDMQHKKVVTWLAQHNFPHGMVAFMDGLSTDPLRQKANYLKMLIEEANIDVQAAYGSVKDINIYQGLGVEKDNIFIVGKASKKQMTQAQVLTDGYAAHLTCLMTHGRLRPAKGNARLFLRKSCFSLPGQLKSKKKLSTKRSCSHPVTSQVDSSKNPAYQRNLSVHPAIAVSHSGNTTVDAGLLGGAGNAVRPRGTSPRPKFLR